MQTDEIRGLIFDIQAHSVHDGPGTRTLVFMSGCPLRCRWCANPEGQSPRPRLMYKAQFCRKCPFRCVEACPQGAARRTEVPGPPVWFDRKVCEACDGMDCAKVCYRQALQLSGKWYGVDELMRIFERDRSYWGKDGGITLSGGEPLLQHDFLRTLLERCQKAGISTCLETNAYVPRPVLESVLPSIEWLFVDLKHMDSAKHAEGTGVPNEPILDNIRWIALSKWSGRMIVRVPVIPGYNDGLQNAQATAGFLKEVGAREINLLPFHRLGASKYEQLGMPYEYAEHAALSAEDLEPLANAYRQQGISCYLGSDTPF